MHEASLHDDNCFLTLTYDNDNLPDPPSLDQRHVQLFLKRLRKKISPQKVRYVYAGEYGDKTYRPHYHALLFGYDFADKLLHSRNRDGHNLYTSQTLTETWGLGHCLIGSVSFESAAYVARYCLKKRTGKAAESHYTFINEETGEVVQYTPEFFQASLKPGIGRGWIDQFRSDVYPHDYVVVNGHKARPPRAYDSVLSEKEVEQIKRGRIERARNHKKDNTKERLRTREKIQIARIRELVPRKVE